MFRVQSHVQSRDSRFEVAHALRSSDNHTSRAVRSLILQRRHGPPSRSRPHTPEIFTSSDHREQPLRIDGVKAKRVGYSRWLRRSTDTEVDRLIPESVGAGTELPRSRKSACSTPVPPPPRFATPDLECRWGYLGACGGWSRSRHVEGNPRNVALRTFGWQYIDAAG